MLADPYPVYRQLRENDPVHWHEPFGAWILTRYHDVLTVLHDSSFSAKRTGKMRQMAAQGGLTGFFSFLSRRMLYADPPRHTLRGTGNCGRPPLKSCCATMDRCSLSIAWRRRIEPLAARPSNGASLSTWSWPPPTVIRPSLPMPSDWTSLAPIATIIWLLLRASTIAWVLRWPGLEGQIALSTLARRFPKLRLEATPLEYRDSFNQRCLKALPVRFE